MRAPGTGTTRNRRQVWEVLRGSGSLHPPPSRRQGPCCLLTLNLGRRQPHMPPALKQENTGILSQVAEWPRGAKLQILMLGVPREHQGSCCLCPLHKAPLTGTATCEHPARASQPLRRCIMKVSLR